MTERELKCNLTKRMHLGPWAIAQELKIYSMGVTKKSS